MRIFGIKIFSIFKILREIIFIKYKKEKSLNVNFQLTFDLFTNSRSGKATFIESNVYNMQEFGSSKTQNNLIVVVVSRNEN